MHQDIRPLLQLTTKSRLDKALNSLSGIFEGISIDKELSDRENDFLIEWFEQHEDLQARHPFNELMPVVEGALADNVITKGEQEDILWLCNKLMDNSRFYDAITADLQTLHGVLAGIISDGVVEEFEVLTLQAWLANHEHLKTCWPYDEVDAVVTAVMADGIVDEEEQQAMLAFFSEFVNLADDKTVTTLPALKDGKISGLCAIDPKISFQNNVFCFTGASSRGPRADLADLVRNAGGVFVDNMSQKVDYLIVGAEGNPCWAYACYGRKVEKAVELRKEGLDLLIVHENDFWDCAQDMGL